ncbi:MAG: hypothetical protein MZV70_11925 [Desulfobacterales bacterium]|nr:hypothetical protein [Desulfobacterales bacterium]
MSPSVRPGLPGVRDRPGGDRRLHRARPAEGRHRGHLRRPHAGARQHLVPAARAGRGPGHPHGLLDRGRRFAIARTASRPAGGVPRAWASRPPRRPSAAAILTAARSEARQLLGDVRPQDGAAGAGGAHGAGRTSASTGSSCPATYRSSSGSNAYRPFFERHRMPCVVAGFEPADILQAIAVHGRADRVRTAPRLENAYPRAVTDRRATSRRSKCWRRSSSRPMPAGGASAASPRAACRSATSYAAYDAGAALRPATAGAADRPGAAPAARS